MKKSFKKALAAFLAALMVIFSVPFTALAAPGDYNPDIQLQFGTYHATNGGKVKDWQDYTAASGDDYSMCGIYDVPLDYDAKAGTLTLSAAKAANAAGLLGLTAPDTDVQYGVGDFFTVTVRIDNIQKMSVSEFYINYSDNIEPAGNYLYKSGRFNLPKNGTISEAAADSGDFQLGGYSAIDSMSCSSIYNKALNYQAGNLADRSTVLPDKNAIFVSVITSNGESVDVSSVYNEYYADPNTGALEGYTYENTCLAETFIFKITGEGPITFDLYDKDNTKVPAYGGCYYIADNTDGILTSLYTTYAPSYGGPNGSTDPNAGAENPGSRKMTFMGVNENVAGPVEPQEHTHTYDPVTTPPECEKDGYITYTCNNSDGLGAVGDDTYVEGVELHPELAQLGHDYVIISETDSTCKVQGEIVYECSRCKDTYTDYKELSKTHTPALDPETAVAATCAKDGKEADTVCSVCGITLETGATISKDTVAHTFTTYVSNDDAKCGVDGTETATCDVCANATDTRTDVGSALEHNGVLAPETAVAATCAKDGKEADTVCSLCGATLVTGATISKDTVAHTYTTYVSNGDAKCGVDGTETATCDVCHAATDTRTDEGSALTHSYTNYVYNNDATYGKDGTETATCDHGCGKTDTRTAAGTALKGVKVTVLGSELGNVYVNGDAVVDSATVDVANNADVTLKAEANEGAIFAGWAVNGKIVSTDAEITIKALADVTYEPIFQAKTADKFTVVFTDRFGNVYDTQTVASGAEITIPAGPVIPGYDFVGWSMTNEEIAALTSAATINARYERIVAQTYTVTANGCTITTPYATTQDVNTGIGYDTLVTVTAPGATAWKIGDAFVAYGESYSFYVGSNVELTVVKSAVTATPKVAAVSTTEIGSAGALKASFLATRSMVAGTTYVNAGFVFAVDPANTNITLADVNGSTVLKSFCATDSEQFCLNIGRREQSGTIVARAFLAYVDDMGTTHVVYAEPQSYTYR